MAGFLLFFMALGAQLVHYIFLFEFTLYLEFLYDSGILRKYGMTNFTVTKLFLVLVMRKTHITSFAAR